MTKNKILVLSLVLTLVLSFFVGTSFVGASPLEDGLNQFKDADPGLVVDGNLINYVSTVFNWILGLVGTALFLLFSYGGFVYMTASGNESETKKGVAIITNATIGIIVLFAAWLISDYVISAILAA